MEALLKVSTPMKYDAGALVLDYHGDMSLMYVLVRGAVEVTVIEVASGESYRSFSLEAGRFFGGLKLVKGNDKAIKVVCTKDAVILQTTLERVKEYQKDHSDGAAVYLELMKRSHAFNQKVSSLAKPMKTEQEGAALISDDNMGNVKAASQHTYDFEDVVTTKLQHTMIMFRTYNCPLCKETFKSHAIRDTKLKVVRQGAFFMNEFQDIDPLWYELVICPKCGYIEKVADFSKKIRYNEDRIRGAMTEAQNEYEIAYSEFRTAYEVADAFKRYEKSLEIKDADVKVKARASLLTYEFFRRLGAEEEASIYRDKAFDLYTGMFTGGILDVTDSQMQQLYLIIGKLHEHRGEMAEAKNQYRLAKMMRGDVKREFAQLAEDYIIDLDMD